MQPKVYVHYQDRSNHCTIKDAAYSIMERLGGDYTIADCTSLPDLIQSRDCVTTKLLSNVRYLFISFYSYTVHLHKK